MREKISSHDLTHNSILRINDRKTLQLIHEYKKEECLWNTSLDDYPNRTKRQRASEKIARILNIKNFDGKHVLIKFKNLRNSYSQELKKIKHSMDKVGPNSPELYRPKVQWFPLMDSFIRPHLQTSKLFGDDMKQFEVVPNLKMECYDVEDQDDWNQPQIDAEPVANYSQSEGHSENEEISNDSRAKRRRRRSNSSAPSDNLSQNQVFLTNDVVAPATSASVATRTEDTYDNFAKYIASLLRNLPPQKALRLQPKIVDMIVSVSVEEENHAMIEINRLGKSVKE